MRDAIVYALGQLGDKRDVVLHALTDHSYDFTMCRIALLNLGCSFHDLHLFLNKQTYRKDDDSEDPDSNGEYLALLKSLTEPTGLDEITNNRRRAELWREKLIQASAVELPNWVKSLDINLFIKQLHDEYAPYRIQAASALGVLATNNEAALQELIGALETVIDR